MKHERRDAPAVLVFGAGSVGLGAGSFLLSGGGAVDFVARPATCEALAAHGLRRTGILGGADHAPGSFGIAARTSDAPRPPYDYILVTVKSYDSAVAAGELAAASGLLSPEGRIVLLQNGWGNATPFLPRFGESRILHGRVITGFRRLAPHHADITVHADAVRIGSLFGGPGGAAQDLCEAMSAGGLPCTPSADIAADLWEKILYNCALNPLGAILDAPYGALAASPPTRPILDAVIAEVYETMTAAGYHARAENLEAYLKRFHEQLLPPTARHESSMLQDLRAGRRTEIDALTGAVLALAGDQGRALPYNAQLHGMIRFLEGRGAPRE